MNIEQTSFIFLVLTFLVFFEHLDLVDVVLIGHEQRRVLCHGHVLECVTCEVGDTPVPCGQQREGGGVKPEYQEINVEAYFL